MMRNKCWLIILFIVCVLFSVPANAAAKISPVTIWTDGGLSAGGGHLCFDEWMEGAKVISARSSRPKVLKVETKRGNDANYGIYLTGLKKGRSKVTVTYKWKGKMYKTSAVYTVRPYPQVFSSFKVNGKEVRFDENPSNYRLNARKTRTLKVRYALRKGWKLVHSEGVYYSGGQEKYFKPVNGKKMQVVRPKTFINYMFQKGKDTFMYQISVMMPGA